MLPHGSYYQVKKFKIKTTNAGGPGIQGHSQIGSEFKASLGYLRPNLKNRLEGKKKKKRNVLPGILHHTCPLNMWEATAGK